MTAGIHNGNVQSRPSPLLQPAVRPDGTPDPYLVYLEGLNTPESQRTMRGCLDAIVGRLVEEEIGGAAYERLEKVTGLDRPWWLLRPEDVRHIRDLLVSPRPAPPGVTAQVLSPASVAKHLSALRGVLEKCGELGLMGPEVRDYLLTMRELSTVRPDVTPPLLGRATESGAAS